MIKSCFQAKQIGARSFFDDCANFEKGWRPAALLTGRTIVKITRQQPPFSLIKLRNDSTTADNIRTYLLCHWPYYYYAKPRHTISQHAHFGLTF